LADIIVGIWRGNPRLEHFKGRTPPSNGSPSSARVLHLNDRRILLPGPRHASLSCPSFLSRSSGPEKSPKIWQKNHRAPDFSVVRGGERRRQERVGEKQERKKKKKKKKI